MTKRTKKHATGTTQLDIDIDDDILFAARVKRVAVEIEQLEQETRGVAVAPTSVDQLYVAQNDLQKLVITRWFNRHYTLPRDAISDGVEVLRSDLLMRINRALQTAHLPVITRRDPLWTDWFLGTVVKLDPRSTANGHRVSLCPRYSASAMADALEDVVDALRSGQLVTESQGSPAVTTTTTSTTTTNSAAAAAAAATTVTVMAGANDDTDMEGSAIVPSAEMVSMLSSLRSNRAVMGRV